METKRSSPSTVMYEDLKAHGIKHREAAGILYDLDYVYGGRTIAERLKKRTDLSRFYVHVDPGHYDQQFFADFQDTTQKLTARLLKTAGGEEARYIEQLEEHYRHTAPLAMQEALESYDIDPAPYRNAVARIANGEFPGATDRLQLYLMLFIVTGCLGDPRLAVPRVDDFGRRRLGVVMHTIEAQSGAGAAAADTGEERLCDLPLGIIRISNDMTMMADHSLHVLPAAEVTTLGSGDCDITDVDAQVSRRHACIWKEGGRWYIEGARSTNGISVISGDDKTVRVVEPPRSRRARGYRPQPFEILPADTICLGETTRYMVRLVDVGP